MSPLTGHRAADLDKNLGTRAVQRLVQPRRDELLSGLRDVAQLAPDDHCGDRWSGRFGGDTSESTNIHDRDAVAERLARGV